MATPQSTHTVLEVTSPRGTDNTPLVARFGGMERRWQNKAILNDRPKEGYSGRRAIEQRLLAQRCERCGAEAHGAGHHIRTRADLHTQGRKATPVWVKRLAMRKRTTVVVCRSCHEAIHDDKPTRHKSVV